MVLVNHIPVPTVADRFGIHTSSVYKIARGKNYAYLRPDLPRRRSGGGSKGQLTCNHCVHFTGDATRPCQLDLPEANTWRKSPPSRGPSRIERSGNTRAAATCAAYIQFPSEN